MSKINILNIEPGNYSPSAIKLLEGTGDVIYTDSDQSEPDLTDVDILITRLHYSINEGFLKTANRLKVIATATTGLDHIDLDYAREKNIAVISLKGETDFLKNVTATAEHTWGLLLSLVRKIPFAFESVKTNKWQRDEFKGIDLSGRNIGIYGYGRIGRIVAEYANVFRMKVYAYDTEVKDIPDYVNLLNTKEELFDISDILTIHIPLNKETDGIVNIDLLKRLKDSYLVNTSRGEIVNDADLLYVLEEGILKGAAIDVITGEREMNEGNKLVSYARNHNNLIITPHIGGATSDSMEKTEIFIAEKIVKHIKNIK
jgi:D-3-phosphoglycerate dehydrogenase